MISRALKRLEAAGLVRIGKRSRYHSLYSLMKVKSRCSIHETQMPQACNSDLAPVDTNNNKLIRNNNDIANKDKRLLNLKASKRFKPETKEELLALDIARELNDLKSLSVYLSYAKKYPESLLRQFLGKATEVPARNIRKGRAVLFNCLVKNMPIKPLKIIGINPGTRYLSISVFEGPELMHWRIKVLKRKWSEEKMKRAVGIVSDFINYTG